MITNASSKRNLLRDLWANKSLWFCPHLVKKFRTHLPTVYKAPAWGLALDLACFLHKRIVVCFPSVKMNRGERADGVCARAALAFPAGPAQHSMRLSKHSMAAGAGSQGWGREEGMRLGGNKSKFLWNDLTGNDRVSALYNRTARERERAGEVLPKHRAVPDLSRWGWWNNKAFPVCVFH